MTNDEIFDNMPDRKLQCIEFPVPEATEASKSTDKKENTVDDKQIQEDKNPEVNEKTKVTEKESSFFDSTDSSSDDSESEVEYKLHNFVNETNGKELRKFREKTKNTRPGLASVKAAINGKPVRRNNIFEEPSKSVPLPRKNCTINVTFSERKFPTPARESSHLEEQEVFFSFFNSYIDNLSRYKHRTIPLTFV